MVFENRTDAGKRLAGQLSRYMGKDTVVLGMPRGGVVVAYEVARALWAPLDVMVARKIGLPMNPEFGIGAIAPGGVVILDEESVRMFGITETHIRKLIEREKQEMEDRIRRYRGDLPFPELEEKTVILVDDGLATGVTARAAVRSIRAHKPHMLILAVPACARETSAILSREVDELYCLTIPPNFRAVSQYYHDFAQTTDAEVILFLEKARKWSAHAAPAET